MNQSGPAAATTGRARRPGSLQGHLLLLVLTVVVAGWLATGLMTWFDARHELDELLDGHLAQAAAVLVVQQTHEIGEDHEYNGIDAPTLHRYAPKVAFQVFHAGHLTLRSASASEQPMAGSPSEFKTGFRTVLIDGVTWRVFAAYGVESDVQVYVGEELQSRDNILWAVLRSTLWPMAVALPLLALALWWAVSRGLLPLRQLGGALALRGPEALTPISLPQAPAEMRPVVGALNSLFDRIGTLIASERRFTADAAHELRTPIAAIRAQAQVALGETDDALRSHALQALLDGCDRAGRLVEQMLTLSRLEAEDAPPMATLDLCEITRQVMADLAPKAIDKDQLLELDALGSLSLTGNAPLLSVLLRNLIDNAIRYSPPRARVVVTVLQESSRFRVTVQDGGPGLPAQVQTQLGVRFLRLPGCPESGSGLGWSIILRIAKVHQLEVTVGRSTALGGTEVSVSGTLLARQVPARV